MKNFNKPIDVERFPRFSGISTFFRLPSQTQAANVDIALIGVPFDGGTTNRPGARHGPREVRNMSNLIRPYNPFHNMSPYDLFNVADLGDVSINPLNVNESLDNIEQYYRITTEQGASALTIGGDHLITLPILRGIATREPLAVVQFDAHSDTSDTDFTGTKLSHGTTFRRAHEEGLVDLSKSVQIGIRGSLFSLDELDWAKEHGVRIVSIEEFNSIGAAATADLILETVGRSPAYLSFDIDVLDPSISPGTGTPEIGGLASRDAIYMIRRLSELNLRAADLVEVSPPFDVAHMTAICGATLAYEILCSIAISRRASLTGEYYNAQPT